MNSNKYIFSLLVTVAGILMIVSPEVFFKMGVIILGIAAAIDGLFVLVTTRHLIIDPHFRLMMTIRGILSLVIGVLAVIFPLFIATSFIKIVAWGFGGYLIVSACFQCYGITMLYRNGIMIRQSVIEVIVSLISAAVLFIIPVNTTMLIIFRILGVLLVLSGLSWTFFIWYYRPLKPFE